MTIATLCWTSYSLYADPMLGESQLVVIIFAMGSLTPAPRVEHRCRQTFWQGGQYSIAMMRLSDRLSQLQLPVNQADSGKGSARQTFLSPAS